MTDETERADGPEDRDLRDPEDDRDDGNDGVDAATEPHEPPETGTDSGPDSETGDGPSPTGPDGTGATGSGATEPEPGGQTDGTEDPLDVTEDDIDVSGLDEAELEAIVSLLEEASSDPERVERPELETLLSVFEDAGIDTEGLDVEDLEERFDETRKVARMVVGAAANTGEYAGLASIRAGSRMAEAAFTSESPRDLLQETTDIARDELGRLGLPFGDSRRRDSSGRNGERRRRERRRRDREDDTVTVEDLRRHGRLLLDLAADVDHEEPFHPAYRQIVTQLAADEARVLRLLATEGPQPALDVYERGLLPFGKDRIDEALTMIDTDAGLQYGDRSDVYLDNLERLGLLEVSDSMLEDLERYRVLRAQPNVERAVASARRASTERRSVRLTDLGVDFCRTVFEFEIAETYDVGT